MDDVSIIGPGAIGSTVAAILHQAGRTPRLYGRTARNGLEVHIGDEAIHVPGPVRTDPEHVDDTAGTVFLAVKATQIEGAAPWLAKLCGPGTVLCILQNGVEQAATVAPLVPEGTVIVPAVVWFPAQAQADGSVRLRGAARLTLPDAPGADRIVETLQGTRCTVELASDFPSVAWRKLLQNAAAGLMALTGRRAGMFARDDVAELTVDYLRECLSVARAEGARLGDGVPEEILDGFRSSPADLSTSILTDREAGRALEWDTRNGVISRLGRTHGIPTPISDVVTALLAATSDGPG
jgi:2-dehydropantoate 2-reductase